MLARVPTCAGVLQRVEQVSGLIMGQNDTIHHAHPQGHRTKVAPVYMMTPLVAARHLNPTATDSFQQFHSTLMLLAADIGIGVGNK